MTGVRTWGLLIAAAAIVLISGCEGSHVAMTDNNLTPPPWEHSQALSVMEVEPGEPRWRDIGDELYSPQFRGSFRYGEGGGTVLVKWQERGSTLRGQLTAHSLKSNFAYQIKLMGLEGIRGIEEAANKGNALAWSSYQLGRLGRWWCENCHWNVSDQDLRSHLDQGHIATGYLLFDWFVADAEGDATAQFALDSSYHVLWKLSQRDRGANDTPARLHGLRRGSYAYPQEVVGSEESMALYGEWEPTRPLPGQARLPAGQYEVAFNVTEESFHADASVPSGGFWAQVLEAPISFTVTSGGQVAGLATRAKGQASSVGRKARLATATMLRRPWSWLRGRLEWGQEMRE